MPKTKGKYRLKVKRGKKTDFARSNTGDILDFDSKTDAARMSRIFKTKKIKIIKV